MVAAFLYCLLLTKVIKELADEYAMRKKTTD